MTELMGKMYKNKGYDPQDDDYIVVEELVNTVALMNARLNIIIWLPRHQLKLEFTEKSAPTDIGQGKIFPTHLIDPILDKIDKDYNTTIREVGQENE